MTDTHCHLNLNIFQEDLANILERAWERGLRRILVPGIDLATSHSAVEMAERYPNLYAAVGIHPGDASSWDENSAAELRTLAGHAKVVAIGEIGLDYYRDRSPRPLQRQVFRTQLELAGELGLPVVIHNRESTDDLWTELSNWQSELTRGRSPLAQHPGVLHSFDGSASFARQVISGGFFIGISGPVTYKNARERQEIAAGLPLNHLLIETDAPYLTPHPFRGRRNEPAYVALVAEKIAALQERPMEEISQATWENAAQLFGWGVDF